MEFKVWVEGIQRVVCGVTEDTTCHDVVIALAHAIGRTGRFKLIEKWRENERLVPPSECPLKLLRGWGEYASDVQYLLKCSGENSTRSSSGKSSCRSLLQRNEDKNLNSFVQHLMAPYSPPQTRKTVKRNLTFSGARQSQLLTPLKGLPRKHPPLPPPFENSSLDSVEEQSSLSSHSSSSPYSSFQSAGSSSRAQNNNGELVELSGQVPERPHYDNFKAGNPAAMSSTLSTPVTSTQVTLPTNNEGNCHPCLSSETSSSSHGGQHCQMPHHSHQSNNNNNSHIDDHPSYGNSVTSSSRSRGHGEHPEVLSQSAGGVAELRIRFFNGGSDRVDSSTANNSSYSSPSVLQSNRPSPGKLKSSKMLFSNDLITNQKVLQQQTNQKEHFETPDNRFLGSQHSNQSTYLGNQITSNTCTSSNSPTQDGMHLNHHQNSSQRLGFDYIGDETDENRNTKRDLSSVLENGGDFSEVSRDDLVRLVNLQIEKLNAQEEQQKHVESEIVVCDQCDLEEVRGLESLGAELERLTEKEQVVEGELEELEIVSWQDKLEMEHRQGERLKGQLEVIQNHLSRCQSEMGSHDNKCTQLLSGIETERSLSAEQKSLAKQKQQALIQEVSDLQEQLNQSVVEHEKNEKTLEGLDSEVKSLESGILEKNTELSRIEKELKETNLQVFVLKPMISNKPDVVNDLEKSQNGRHTSESDIPFTRSSSSRAGIARKIPSTAMALKEALESEPQGYWV